MKAGLDIGNTRSKLGLFDGESIQMHHIGRQPEDLHQAIDQYGITDLIVTSVARDLIEDEILIQRLNSFIWLSHLTPLPISLEYTTPETLGRDRIATAVGASVLFPDENAIVIDAGTCTTVDVVENGKIFKGGYISPGIQMRWKAMHQYTAKLPLVKEWEPVDLIGKTTHEAMMLGGLMSMVMELEGFIQRMKNRYQLINVILTGGDGTIISENTVSEIDLCPNLLMEGLREIQRYNA